MKPMLKPPGTKHLKLKYDVRLTSFAFEFNLRRSIVVWALVSTSLLALVLGTLIDAASQAGAYDKGNEGVDDRSIDRSIHRRFYRFPSILRCCDWSTGRVKKTVELSTNHSRWRSIDRSIDRQHLHYLCHTLVQLNLSRL